MLCDMEFMLHQGYRQMSLHYQAKQAKI